MPAVSALMVVLACGSINAPVRAQATFTPLGLFGGIDSAAYDVSADGTVVVGLANFQVFRWENDQTIILPRTHGPAVSADGSTIVGGQESASGNAEAFRWTATGGFMGLGDLPGGNVFSNAYGVSANGQVVVGQSDSAIGSEAFRWTEATGMVGLGDLPGGETRSLAWGVSADGAIVVGHAQGAEEGIQAFRWTVDTGMVGLGMLPGAFESLAYDASADGSVVVGINTFRIPGPLNFRTEAFRWTPSDGMLSLGDLPGALVDSEAYGVSADGSVIVGNGVFRNQQGEARQAATYWTAELGMVNLQDLLISAGATGLDGWTLVEARSVSDDGLTVVGWGSHNFRREAFVATIPEPSTVAMAVFAAGSLLPLVRRRWRRNRSPSADR